MNPLAFLIPGFLAGFGHVFAGPDHLAAVAPLSTRREGAWLVGLRWGLGHGAGVALVALGAVFLKAYLQIEVVSAYGERLVGFMLLAIGAIGLYQGFRRNHDHSEPVHGSAKAPSPAEKGKGFWFRLPAIAPFFIGTLHGLAGSSHLLGVLPALVLPDTASSLLYLSGFACGTVAAMASFSEGLGRLSQRLGLRWASALSVLTFMLSVTALAVGAFWLASSF